MRINFDKLDQKIDDERLARKINQRLSEQRPKTEEFYDVYDEATIAHHQQEIVNFESKKGIINKEEKLTDGICLEYIFSNLDMNDFFMEEPRYDELMTDNEDYLLKVIPTHKYDDEFHNADMICVMRNELTEHKTVPFVVDCTSNSEKIDQKLNYRRTNERLKGFTKLFYFKNPAEEDEGDGSIPKGKVEIIPRFVIGVDSDKARRATEYRVPIANRERTWEEQAKEEEAAKSYDEVRLCVFEEFNQQCDAINEYLLNEGLELLDAEQAKQITEQMTALKRYFSETLKKFKQERPEVKPSDYVRNEILDKAA